MLKPAKDDWDALVLYADHEFLNCGGKQVGALYRYVLEKQPAHIRANLGMGEWYTAHKKYADAVSYLERVRKLADSKSAEYRHAGKVLEFARYKLKEK